jgi:iron(III) transport system substrate-binding protein
MKKIQIVLILCLFGHVVMANEVNIYTSRHYDSDDALYAEFTKETGIAVNIVSGKGSALLQRLKAEGVNSPADIFFYSRCGQSMESAKRETLSKYSIKKCIKSRSC